MRPTFSLILPTHNRGEILERNLQRLSAVAAELPEDLEIIVVDNASTDRTADLVERRFRDVRLIRLDRNRSTAARNEAANQARGSILVMLDDDSFIDALSLRRIARVMCRDPDLHAVAARVCRTTTPERHEGGGLPGVFIGCGAAIRRQVFLELGGYPDDYDYYVEEYDLCIRLWQAGGQVRWYDDIVVHHDRSPENRDFNRIVRFLTRNNLRLWDRYAPPELREEMIFETVERYSRIARKECAGVGFLQGLAEAAHLLPTEENEPSKRSDDPRAVRRLNRDEFDRVYGLSEACRIIAADCHRLRAKRPAMWGRGKGAEQLVSLVKRLDLPPLLIFDPDLDESVEERSVSQDWHGVEVLPAARIVHHLPDVLIIGSLSPGACRDGAAHARRFAPQAHIIEPVAWAQAERPGESELISLTAANA